MRGFERLFSRTDYVLALVVFAAMVAMLISFKLIRTDQLFGDSAVYFQATENIASRGIAVSQVSAAIDNGFKYFSTSAEQIAKDPRPLFGGPTTVSERSLFRGHAYVILYPIALLVRMFPVRIVLMSLCVLTFTGMVLLAYFVLRSKSVSVTGACLFCLLIVSHPAWSEGLLLGQFYPDRLFILAGFIFMILASRRNVPQTSTISNRVWLVIAATVCASINERGALVAGIFLLSYVALYWKEQGLDRYYLLALGIGLFVYGYGVLKLLTHTNSDYSSFLPTSLDALLQMVQQPHFAQLGLLFLLVNAPLLCLALFEWRAAAIAVILMIPNIFGNIGGAEKVGWSTHYPSFFLPSLVWAAFIGYSALSKKAATGKAMPAFYGITCATILFLSMLNPYSYPLDFKLANVNNTFLPSFNYYVDQYIIKSVSRDSLTNAADGIRQAVPPHTLVSTVEFGMALLYRDRTLEFFPADIDRADYAVLGAQEIDGKIQYGGAVSYLGPVEENKLNALVVDRMKRDGYDMAHPARFPGFTGLAVVKRVH